MILPATIATLRDPLRLASGAVILSSIVLIASPLRAQGEEVGRAAAPPGATLSASVPDSVAPGPMTGIEAAEVGVLKLWFARQRLLEAGDPGGADRKVRELEALMDREQIRGMEVLAGAFAHEGYAHLESGNYLRAKESFELALRFDRGLPSAHFGLGRARRLAGDGWGGYLSGLSGGARAMVGNFWYSYVMVSNALFLLLVALAAAGVLFAVLSTLRHQAEWRHDVGERLHARGASEAAGRLAGWVVFLLPLLFWLSGVWLLLWWMLGTSRYMRRGERVVAIGAVLVVLAAAPGLGYLLSVFRVTESPTVKATVSALRGGYEPDKVKYIQQALVARPDDPRFHFLIASVLKDGGYFVEAFEHYKKVIELDPTNHRAYNNVGNIYFTMGQHGEALNWYRKATEAKTDYAIGFFNAHLAQNEQFHYTEATASLERAKSIDPDAVNRIQNRAGGATAPVDDKIPMSDAWFEVVRRGPRIAAGGQLPPPPATFVNPVSLAAGLALVGMIGLPLLGSTRSRARICPRCGRATCPRCGADSDGIEFCPQCAQLFLRKEAVAPELRARKQRQVARWESLSRVLPRLISLVLPGGGQVLTGRAVWGGLLLFVWALLGLHLWLAPQLLGFPASPYSPPAAGLPWATLLSLAAVWLLGNVTGVGRLGPSTP